MMHFSISDPPPPSQNITLVFEQIESCYSVKTEICIIVSKMATVEDGGRFPIVQLVYILGSSI